MLITAAWPTLPDSYVDPEAQAEIDWLIQVVSEVRSIRSEMNVPPGARAPLVAIGAAEPTKARLKRHRDLIATLARLDSVREGEAAGQGAVPFVIGEATFALGVAEFVDLAAERARLAKEIGGLEAEIERTAKKLANADFVARAPEAVVEENRERLAEAEGAKAKLQAALQRLEAVG